MDWLEIAGKVVVAVPLAGAAACAVSVGLCGRTYLSARKANLSSLAKSQLALGMSMAALGIVTATTGVRSALIIYPEQTHQVIDKGITLVQDSIRPFAMIIPSQNKLARS